MATGKTQVLFGTGLLLVALSVFVYRSFPPASEPRPAATQLIEIRPNTFEDEVADGPAGSPDAEGPTPTHPLQSYVLSMPAESRESLFLLAIRDAGLACDDLLSAVQMAEATPVWRVACLQAAAYLLEVDSVGEMRIEPLHYGEGLPFGPSIIDEPRPRGPQTLPAPTPQR